MRLREAGQGGAHEGPCARARACVCLLLASCRASPSLYSQAAAKDKKRFEKEKAAFEAAGGVFQTKVRRLVTVCLSASLFSLPHDTHALSL